MLLLVRPSVNPKLISALAVAKAKVGGLDSMLKRVKCESCIAVQIQLTLVLARLKLTPV